MSENSTHESREFTRVPLHLEVQLKIADKVIKSTQTRDLSMKGVFVICREKFPLHSPCDVSLFLQAMEPIEVHFRGKVEREMEGGLAIEFTEMDLESFEHLQKLLRYNSSDSDQIDEELHTHIGLKKKS